VSSRPPVFLQVRVGDTVEAAEPGAATWLGSVIHAEDGARGPEVSFVQAACVDTGLIRMLSVDCLTTILAVGSDMARKVAGS